MNSNRKNSGWILCPSKSVAGSFYYFNVLTGDAVWSLNDAQARGPKNDCKIQRVIDRHTYRPQSPPAETSNCLNFHSMQPNMRQTIPTFGQVLFPQYISNVQPAIIPSVIWSPMPMFANATEEKIKCYCSTKRDERPTHINTCVMPLSQRFKLLNTNKALDNRNIFENTAKFNASTPKTKNWWNSTKNDAELELHKRKLDSSILKEPKLKRFRFGSEEINKKIEMLNGNSQKNLDTNDLRYVLMKRRKTIDSDNLHIDKENEKDIYKENLQNPNLGTKKQVTFNLVFNDKSIITKEGEEINDDFPNKMSIKFLRNLGKFTITNTEWYLAVDQDVLLSDFDFIMTYISADDDCKLLLPNQILKHVKSLAVGEHAGRRSVMVARQAYRRLTDSQEKVRIQETGEENTLTNQILNCCLATIDQHYHLVLVTNNTELYKKAKLYDIHVYTINDVKNYEQDKILSIDRKQTRYNISKDNQNIFLQKANDVNPFAFSKSAKNSLKQHNVFDDSEEVKTSSMNNNETNDSNDINNLSDFSHLSSDIQKLNIHNSTEINEINRTDKIIDNCLNSNTNKKQSKSFKPLHFQKIFFDPQNENTQNYTYELLNIQKKVMLNENQIDNFIIKKKICVNNVNQKTISSNLLGDNQNNNSRKEKVTKIGNFFNVKSMDLSVDESKSNWAAKDSKKCSIEDKFNRFHVKDYSVENTTIIRKDEWFCSYRQIMEEFINIVLQNNMLARRQLPCSFREGLECLKYIYLDHRSLKIIDKLLSLWENTQKGNKNDTIQSELIKMIECGLLLVDIFKNILPDDFKGIEDLLTNLLETIESPVLEELEETETPQQRHLDSHVIFRCNFVKDRSEIIQYLKKHFTEWKDYTELEEIEALQNEENNQAIHILRTRGKDLGTFKLDNRKRITFNNPLNKEDKVTVKNNSLENLALNKNAIVNDNDKNGPKMIRKLKIIAEFEKRINKINKNPEFGERLQLMSVVDENNDVICYDNLNNVLNSKFIDPNDISINDRKNKHLYDSGGNDNLNASAFLRVFLVELTSTLTFIYNFADNCHSELRKDDIKIEEKQRLYDDARDVHSQMTNIINKLKSIIRRESESNKLKSMLIKAGDDVTEDKRLSRYRQTVTKCLEQAQILDSCLKLILNTSENNTLSSSSVNIDYINIFE